MDQTTSYQDLQLGKWLAGAAVGAVVMYMLDPERGAARRAESGQKLRALGRQAGNAVDQAAHQLEDSLKQAGQAVHGAAAEAGMVARETLTQAAGASAAGAAHAWPDWHAGRSGSSASTSAGNGADNGADTAGTMMQSLIQPVRDFLQPAGARGANMPGTALAGGGILALYGLFARRSPLAWAAGLAGVALLARGASSGRPVDTRPGVSRFSRPVAVEKTIRIEAPREQVYDLFANYENFPRFMSNVIEVRDLGDRRSHWVVKGPAGTHFQWNAVLTEASRPRRLAWESEPGAEVEQTGSILFEPFRNGTRVTVHMSYKPPAGAVGHAIAALFGSDPKRQMEQDLARMKSLVERGAIEAGARGAGGYGKALH